MKKKTNDTEHTNMTFKDLDAAERLQAGFMNKFAELIFENFTARSRAAEAQPGTL